MRWFPALILFFLIYTEISLFIDVASVIGVFATLLLTLFTSIMGIWLVKQQGLKTIKQMREKLAIGESPAAEVLTSVALLLAGFLLLLPGFFTDFIGLLLLLPPIHRFLAYKLLPRTAIFKTSQQTKNPAQQGSSSGRIIEGEFQRKDDK